MKYAVTDAWNLYAAAGRGFETPTINELSYRSDGKGGLNINLQPSTNNTYEIGSKTRIARNMGYASFGWEPEEGWYAGADARYMSDVMANDTNTAKAPSYTVVGLNTGYKLNYGKWGMDIFGRVDNLFDKEYVGSEIVNAGYNRYYEPAPGRNYGVGLSVSYHFE